MLSPPTPPLLCLETKVFVPFMQTPVVSSESCIPLLRDAPTMFADALRQTEASQYRILWLAHQIPFASLWPPLEFHARKECAMPLRPPFLYAVRKKRCDGNAMQRHIQEFFRAMMLSLLPLSCPLLGACC